MYPHSLSGSRRCGKLYWWKSWFIQFSLAQKFDKQNHWLCQVLIDNAIDHIFIRRTKSNIWEQSFMKNNTVGQKVDHPFNREDRQLLSLLFMPSWRQTGAAVDVLICSFIQVVMPTVPVVTDQASTWRCVCIMPLVTCKRRTLWKWAWDTVLSTKVKALSC